MSDHGKLISYGNAHFRININSSRRGKKTVSTEIHKQKNDLTLPKSDLMVGFFGLVFFFFNSAAKWNKMQNSYVERAITK